MVLSGRARVMRDGAVVAQLGVGDHFGEFTLLRGLPSPVTIVTEEPTTVDSSPAPSSAAPSAPTTRSATRSSARSTPDPRLGAVADAASSASARSREGRATAISIPASGWRESRVISAPGMRTWVQIRLLTVIPP